MSVNKVNPSNLFGGEWEAISQGRCLMGAGVVETNTDNWCGTTNAGDWTAYAGLMGGEVFHTLTTTQIPAHTHSSVIRYTGTDDNNFSGHLANGVEANDTSTSKDTLTTGSTGGSGSHNNLPPYLVVYMWKRVS